MSFVVNCSFQVHPCWFETGTPSFLIDLLTARQTWLPRLGQLETDATLLANDFAGPEDLITAFFDAIPGEWHTKNPIANDEGYYASVFYTLFAAAGSSSEPGEVVLGSFWPRPCCQLRGIAPTPPPPCPSAPRGLLRRSPTGRRPARPA